MKLKFLAAAAALLCGVNAHAGLNNMDNDAELFFVVWDEAKATFVQDTGMTLGTLRGQTEGKSWSFDVGSNYADYVAADGNLNDFSMFEGTRWALFAADSNNGFQFDGKDYNYLTTMTGGAAPTGDNEAFVRNTARMGDEFTFQHNQLGPKPIDLAANNNLVALKGEAAHFLELTEYGGLVGLLAGNAINSGSTALFLCSSDPFNSFPSACQSTTDSGLEMSTSFDGATFGVNVAAIPEPSTYAMLFAGLAMIGFAARRRRG